MIEQIKSTLVALEVLGIDKRIEDLENQPVILSQAKSNLTGYVPYTGATANVDLGTFSLSAGGVTTIKAGIATTSTQALAVQNTTAANAGAVEQWSPAQDFIGHSWKSGIGASDRIIRFRQEVQTATSSLAPVGTLVWKTSVDTGVASFTDRMTLTTAGLLTVTNATLSSHTAGRALYTGTAGLLTSAATATLDGLQLGLTTSGITGGTLYGTDVLLYRRAANIGAFGSGDSLEVPENIAVGTTISSNHRYYGTRTVTDNTTQTVIRTDLTITGATTTSFPVAGNFSTTIDAGANAIFFSAGVFFSNRSVVGQSGAQTEQWGVYGDVWHRSQGNVSILGGSRAFVNIVAGSAGTITTADGYQTNLSTASGGTQPTITTYNGLRAILEHNGTGAITTYNMLNGLFVFAASSGTITTFNGLNIPNPGANATITTLNGINIALLTRGTNNYAIASAAGNKHGLGTTTPTSTLHVDGSIAGAYVAKTATYTATISDYTIDCTANTFTVTLPTSVGISGRIYVIKNSGAGTITVDGNASETIDGALTAVLSTQYESITIQSNGANFIIL